MSQERSSHSQIQLPTFRLEFPEFNGENPRSWIRKANKYFQVHMIEEVHKIMHASYYLVGAADLWFGEYIEGRSNINWERICLTRRDFNDCQRPER